MLSIEYVSSEKKTIQGKKDEVYRKYGGKYNIKELGGGHGNWLLTKSSDVLVDGKSYRNIVLDYYGETRLTKKLFNQFKKDIASGKIKL